MVKNSEGYISKLYQSKVIIDQEKRKKTLEDQLKKKATEKKLSLALDDSLLEELNGLVEWPVVFTGSINSRHMRASGRNNYFCSAKTAKIYSIT